MIPVIFQMKTVTPYLEGGKEFLKSLDFSKNHKYSVIDHCGRLITEYLDGEIIIVILSNYTGYINISIKKRSKKAYSGDFAFFNLYLKIIVKNPEIFFFQNPSIAVP